MAMAKIPTVSKFLCFFELSTGGLILGYFDAIAYGIVLAFIFLFLIFVGTAALESKALDNLTTLEVTFYAAIIVAVLSCLLFIAVNFIKGVNEKAPKKCLPYVIVRGLDAVLTLIGGLVSLNVGLVILSGIKVYLFLVIYSLYKVLIYGDEQNAYEAHQNAGSAGYEQFYEPEGYNAIDNNEMGGGGYQTTEFKGS